MRARLRLVAELPCQCLTLETVSLFRILSLVIVLVCLDAPQSIVQYRKTTSIEDTYQTITTILF